MSKRRQRGTGTVIEYRHKDGDVSYRVQFYDSEGKPTKETVGRASQGWTRKKVEAHLRDRINAVEKRGWKKPKPVTFSEYADRWMAESETLRAWSDESRDKYRWAKNLCTGHFGSKRLTDIQPQQVSGFTNELMEHYAAASVNLILTTLKMICTAAEDEGLIEEGKNPTRKMRRPKITAYKPRALKPEEARAIEGHLKDPTHKLAFLTFEFLGPRMKELRSLRWRDVDFAEHTLRIEDSKTPTGIRAQAIPGVLWVEFENHFQRSHYQADSDYVFCHPEKGSKMNESNYRQAFREAQRAAGVGNPDAKPGEPDFIRPAHDLRVTSITSGVLTGEHPSKIMQRVGHRSYQTTKGYIDLAGDVFPEDAEALAAMRLGRVTEPQEATEEIR
jgi:integrase